MPEIQHLGSQDRRITAFEASLGARVSERQDLGYQGRVSKQNNRITTTDSPKSPKDPKTHLIII